MNYINPFIRQNICINILSNLDCKIVHLYNVSLSIPSSPLIKKGTLLLFWANGDKVWSVK